MWNILWCTVFVVTWTKNSSCAEIIFCSNFEILLTQIWIWLWLTVASFLAGKYKVLVSYVPFSVFQWVKQKENTFLFTFISVVVQYIHMHELQKACLTGHKRAMIALLLHEGCCFYFSGWLAGRRSSELFDTSAINAIQTTALQCI